jgi:hypothetical protein
MAIKRPTKSRGTPSHKPVASAPLRHVDVRAPQQMVPGEVYGKRVAEAHGFVAPVGVKIGSS